MTNQYRFSVAPMMGWTDRHYRYLARLISKQVWLYTEMVTANTILHTDDPARFLDNGFAQTATVLQLGGSNPNDLKEAARIASAYNYSEMNLNCGCPSPRVKRGAFGACLMSEPELVADCMLAISESVSVPVTVKTRIGIDHEDDFAFLERFVKVVSERAPVSRFIIHARKAWLNGLSPKENREKPPLRYDRVRELITSFPNLAIELNGGIQQIDEAIAAVPTAAGFMIGRRAYQNPYMLSAIDNHFQLRRRCEIECVMAYKDYVADELARGTRLLTLVKPILGMFQGRTGARTWRRILSEEAKSMNDATVILKALQAVSE